MHLRVLNPLRVVVFWVAFLLATAGFGLYRFLFISQPARMSASFRKRHYRRIWSRSVAAWGVTLYWIARLTVGLRASVDGEIPEGRFIVVANHQSTADIPVLIRLFRKKNLKFVVKRELFRWVPNVSSAVRNGGFGVVDATRPHAAVRELLRFARNLEKWEGSPLIFPEGRRTEDGGLGRFRRSGLDILVRESGLPVLPVVLDGLWRARTVSDFFFFLPGSHCRIRIGRPIPSGEAIALDGTLARRLESQMKDDLQRLRDRDAGSGGPSPRARRSA